MRDRTARRRFERWWVGLGLLGLLHAAGASSVEAGIFGVPTNLNANGTTSGTSVNPPGWFNLGGTTDNTPTDQLRLFIEVTGSTLDIRVFDPGSSGARDSTSGTDTVTTYQLLNPCTPFPTCNGTLREQVANFGDDTAATDNTLVRFSPVGGGTTGSFCTLNAGGCTSFTGLAPGLYEFRVTVNSVAAGAEINAFGVDVRDGSGNPYNVYTIGRTAAQVTTMPIGSTAGPPAASNGGPATFFPYGNRGCTLQTSNFDSDGDGPATATSPDGASTNLPVSGNLVHVETTVQIEPSSGVNLESLNYGMFRIEDTYTTGNSLEWQVADFSGWSDNPANLPRSAVNPIRMYLPTSYAPNGTSANAVAPGEPILRQAVTFVSGQNPPGVGGATTRLGFSASLENPTGSPGNLAIGAFISVGGFPATLSNFGNQQCFINGTLLPSGGRSCTFSTVGGGQRATLAGGTLAPNEVLTFNFQADFQPTVATVQALTGAPAAGSPPPNSTTRAQYTSAFATTETVGPICELRIDPAQALTRAVLRGLRVDVARGTVEFATGTQRRTAAFQLYATDDPAGRDGLVALGSPIVSPVPDSTAPVLYRTDVGPIPSLYLMIEEIETTGRRHMMGPFELTDAKLRRAFERLERRLAGSGLASIRGARVARADRSQVPAAATLAVAAAAPTATTRGVKIAVGQPGGVTVAWGDLRAQGLPATTPASGLRLSAFGQSVPFEVLPDGQGKPAWLRFTAAPLSTVYTGEAVYVLTWTTTRPSLRVALTGWEDPSLPGFTRVERNQIYVASAPVDTDPWQWDLLIGDGTTWPSTGDPSAGDFDLPMLAVGSTEMVPVRIRLLGRSGDSHTVDAAINGVAVGHVTFVGNQPGLLEGEVEATVLRPTGNQLTLTYRGTGADLPLAYLNYLELGIPTVATGASGTVERLAPWDDTLPSSTTATYLIVTHAQFRVQADQIAGLKVAEGHRVAVVDVERVYDRFSAGIVEANALQGLIRQVASLKRLRYVLLIGDDTFDTHDYLGTGARTFVPSLLGRDDEFGWIPSDHRYVDLKDDGMPALAIGRLPVQTPAEADVLVDKLRRQTAVVGNNRSRQLFAVDNQGPSDPDFRAAAQAVAAGVPAGTQVQWADISGGIGQARQALLDAWRAGPELIHYFGHAGPEVWADEGLLTADDVGALANTGRETIVLQWACESQWYQGLFGPSLGEALMLVPRGGALASFGPVGITDARQQQQFYGHLYVALRQPGITLGEAVRQAKAAALAADPTLRPVVEGWTLFGDPALRLP